MKKKFLAYLLASFSFILTQAQINIDLTSYQFNYKLQNQTTETNTHLVEERNSSFINETKIGRKMNDAWHIGVGWHFMNNKTTTKQRNHSDNQVTSKNVENTYRVIAPLFFAQYNHLLWKRLSLLWTLNMQYRLERKTIDNPINFGRWQPEYANGRVLQVMIQPTLNFALRKDKMGLNLSINSLGYRKLVSVIASPSFAKHDIPEGLSHQIHPRDWLLGFYIKF